ncbi:MAG: DNA/RNA nuclease SfsA [Draconibacterium sp.]
MIKINGNWVGINTSNPNLLAYEAISAGEIPGLEGYTKVLREVTFGDSRFDIFAENDTEKCFVEVKNVSLKYVWFGNFRTKYKKRNPDGFPFYFSFLSFSISVISPW